MKRIPVAAVLVALLGGCPNASRADGIEPHQVTVTAPAVACQPDDRLFQNLARAAKITLPVSTLTMKYETLPAPTMAEFVRQTGAEPTMALIQRRVAGGETWRFKVEGEYANPRTWPEESQRNRTDQTGVVVLQDLAGVLQNHMNMRLHGHAT